MVDFALHDIQLVYSLTSPQTTPAFREAWWAPREKVLITDYAGRSILTVHPSVGMVLDNHGRMPFFSACTLGERELQRDRRLQTR